MSQPPITHGQPQPGRNLRAVPPPQAGLNAEVRTAARASITAYPQQQTQRETQQGAINTCGERGPFARWITPPNPRTTAPPTWDELRWHGDHGRHAPKAGWPHNVSVVWSRMVALPARAAAVWLDWVVRSPSRTLAVLVLYALLAHLPGLTWLPWFF